jgi:hypothetical protein
MHRLDHSLKGWHFNWQLAHTQLNFIWVEKTNLVPIYTGKNQTHLDGIYLNQPQFLKYKRSTATFSSGKRRLGSAVNEQQPGQATTNQAIRFHYYQNSGYACCQRKTVYGDASGAPHRSQTDYNPVPGSYMPTFIWNKNVISEKQCISSSQY